MKKHMMIIGAEVISSNEKHPDNSIIRIDMIPLTTVKKITSMATILEKGSFEDMIDSALSHQSTQLKDTCFITTGEWRKQGYKIGKHTTLEVLPDDTTGGIK